MSDETIYLTKAGKAKLEGELRELLDKRPVIARQIASTREGSTMLEGDAALEELVAQQRLLESRIHELERTLGSSELIAPHGKRVSEPAGLGYTVTVVDPEGKEASYTIVDSVEADPLNGRISRVSPVGSALVGTRPGDSVEVQVPAGTVRLQVKEIA